MIRTKSPEEAGLALALIQIDGGTQSRATLNDHVVNDYAEAIQAGATFPPIVVFYDGKKHWLADGFHRFHAYQKAGREKVATDVRQGTRRDAILHSVGANETHGLRRTRDDKRRAILTLLNDSEWGAKPETWIAETCRVSRSLVRTVLAEQPHLVEKQDRSTVREVTRGGKTYAMQTAAIGGKPVTKENLETEPATPEPREIEAFEPERVEQPAALPRNIVAEILALWAEANEDEREEVLAHINPPAPEHKAAGHARREMGSNGANAGGNDVDGGASRAGHADQRELAVPGHIETRDRDENFVERTTSGPDAKRAPNSQSAASTAEAVTDKPQAPRPSVTANNSSPANSAVADGQLGIPSSDALAAGQGESLRISAKSEQAVSQFNNPRCQKPETCHLAHSRDECFDCNIAWSKRPKDEQIRLWAEAIQAARAA